MWVGDIKLSKVQKDVLRQNVLHALQRGRVRAGEVQKQRRAEQEKVLLLKGRMDVGSLSPRDLFIAGVALYWAEGFKNKHERRLGFCNSDPDMIKFYLKWLDKSLGIPKIAITVRVTLNYSYKERTKVIERLWSDITGIPLQQFTKPFYQYTNWKKQYKNSKDYRGVLRIHVRESLDHLLTMRGWIDAIKYPVKL